MLAPHQQRVVTEQEELDAKIKNLIAFFPTAIFMKLDVAEQNRLKRQVTIMQDYSDVLRERIEAFKEK